MRESRLSQKAYWMVFERFFELMAEKVTKPQMEEELEKVGEPLATEIVGAIERALGRSVR